MARILVRLNGLSFSASFIADALAKETLNKVNSYNAGVKAGQQNPDLAKRFSSLGQAYPNVPFQMNAYQAMAGTNAEDLVAFNTARRTQEILAKQNDYNLDPITKVNPFKRSIQLGMLGLDAAFQPVSRGFKSAVVAAQQNDKSVLGTVALATLAGLPEIFIGRKGEGGGDVTRGVLNTIMGDGVGDSYQAARDKYGPTQLTMALNERRKGNPLNLGAGFMPRSVDLRTTQEYLNAIRAGESKTVAYQKAKERYGSSITRLHDARADQFKYETKRGQKINISPGRLVASQMLEPGTTGYSVVSGAIDGVFRIAADPVNLALMYGAGVKTAMRSMTGAYAKGTKAIDPTTTLLKGFLPGKTGARNRALYYGRTVDDVRNTKWGQDFGKALAEVSGDEGLAFLRDIPSFRELPVSVLKVINEVDDPIHVWDILDAVAKAGNLSDSQFDNIFNVIKEYVPAKVQKELDNVRELAKNNTNFGLDVIPARPTVYGEVFNHINKLITGQTTDVAPLRKLTAFLTKADPAQGLLGIGAQAKLSLPKHMQRAFSLVPETTAMISQLDESVKNIDNNLRNAFVDARTRGRYIDEALNVASQQELDDIVNRVNVSIYRSVQRNNPGIDVDVDMLVKQQENFNAQMEELRSFFKGSAGSLAFNGTKIKKRYTQLIKDLDEHFKQTGLEVKPDDIERYVFEAVPTMHLLSQASNTFSVIANPKDVIRATKRHQLLVGKKDTKLNAFMKNAEISWDNRKYFDILKIPRYVKEGETLRAPDAFDSAFNMIQNNVLKPAWMIRGALALRIAPEEALRAAFGGKINPFTSAFKRLSLTSNKYYDFFGEGRADQVAQVYDNTGAIVLTTQMTPDSIELLKNFIDVEDVKKFQAINYDKAQKLIKNSMLETNYNGQVSEYMIDAAVNGFDLRQIKFAELTDKDFVAKTKSIKATSKGSIVGYDGNTYNSMGEAFIKGGGFTTDLDEKRFFDLKTRGPAEGDAFVSPYKEKEYSIGKIGDIEREAKALKIDEAEYINQQLDNIFFDEDTIGLLSKDKHVMGTYIDSDGNFMVDVAVGLSGENSVSNAVFMGMNAFQESVYIANKELAEKAGFKNALGDSDLIYLYRKQKGKAAADINIDSVLNKPALQALYPHNFDALRIKVSDVKGAMRGMPGGSFFSADATYNASLGENAVTEALKTGRKDLIENMFIEVPKYLPTGKINPRYWEALWTEIELLASDPIAIKVADVGIDDTLKYLRNEGKETLQDLVQRSHNADDRLYLQSDASLKEYLESVQYRIARLIGAEHSLLDPTTGAIMSAEQATRVAFDNGYKVHPKFVSNLSNRTNSKIYEMIRTGGVVGRKDWVRYKQHNQLRKGPKKGQANAKFFDELIDLLTPEVDAAGLGPQSLPARFDAKQRVSESGTMVVGEKIVPAGTADDIQYYDKTFGGYMRSIDFMYDVLISKPSNKLNRDPLFRYAFYENAVELMPFMDEATKSQFLKGAETWVDGNEIWDDLIQAAKQPSVENTVTSLEQAEMILKAKALREVKELFYSTDKRHVASELFNKYIPFPEIWAEVFQTWGKLITENPQKFNKARITVDNGEEAKPWDSENGFLERDPSTGKLMFNYVDVLNVLTFGVGGRALDALAQKAAFGENLEEEGVRLALPGYAGGLNLVAQNGFAPGFGPLVTVPMTFFVDKVPTPKYIQDFFLGNFGRDLEQWPAWLKKFMTANTKDADRQAQFANAVMDAYTGFVLAGLVDQTDAQSTTKYTELAVEKARNLFIFRGTTQFTLPTAIQPRIEVQDKNGQWWMTQALKNKYDEILIRNDYDYFTTDQEFEAKFGINPVPLKQARGATVGKKPVKEHSFFWWQEDNRKDLLKPGNLPNTGVYIQPDKLEDEMYYPAWYEIASTQYTPEQYAQYMRQSQAISELEKEKARIREEEPERMWETKYSEAKDKIQIEYDIDNIYNFEGKLQKAEVVTNFGELNRWVDFELTKNSPEFKYVEKYTALRNELINALNNNGVFKYKDTTVRFVRSTRTSKHLQGKSANAQKAQDIMRIIWQDIVAESTGTNFPQLANEVLFYEISPYNNRNRIDK